jgi:hypothetical protein
VRRKFEAKELLAAADVPEKLVHLSSSHCELNEMVDALDCPVKMLQAVAEAIGLSLGAVASESRPRDRKRKALEWAMEDVESMTKKISLGVGVHNLDDKAGLVEQAFQPDPGPPIVNLVVGKECEEKEDVHLARE